MKLRHMHREAWFWIVSVFGLAAFLLVFICYPFAPLTGLAVVAAIIRGALLLLTGSAVFLLPDRLTYWQRAGLMGATVGMFMTTQSLLSPHTPWEAWASIIAGGGWLGFVASSFGPEIWQRISHIGARDVA